MANNPDQKGSRRVLWVALVLVGVIAAFFLSTFPTRTWLDQRRDISSARQQRTELGEELAELNARVKALGDPAEIERIAREQYGFVRPGEEAYRVLPEPLPPMSIPSGWPFTDQPLEQTAK
ncbi:MAG: septum formation initiator family protein [Acidimicrobiia bacterium]